MWSRCVSALLVFVESPDLWGELDALRRSVDPSPSPDVVTCCASLNALGGLSLSCGCCGVATTSPGCGWEGFG